MKAIWMLTGALALGACAINVDTPDNRVAVNDPPLVIDGVNFGHDTSEWANDFECDDPRFKGPGMTNTPLLAEDTKRDATDCAAAYRAGQITLR